MEINLHEDAHRCNVHCMTQVANFIEELRDCPHELVIFWMSVATGADVPDVKDAMDKLERFHEFSYRERSDILSLLEPAICDINRVAAQRFATLADKQKPL